MPANKNALIRYRIIDRCLTNKLRKYPTKQYILEKICQDLYGTVEEAISVSSLEKDFDAMRNDASLGYNAPIKYCKRNKGYYYTDPEYSIDGLALNDQETEALQESVSLLKSFGEIPVLKNLSDAIQKINTRFSLSEWSEEAITPYLEFETSDLVPGREWIKQIYDAIKNRNPIRFIYNNTYKNEIREHSLEPHYLKEVKNAWYLLGWNTKRKLFLVYHLDKFQEVFINESQIFIRKEFNPVEHFQNAIGIMGGENAQVERIVLEATGPLARALPLQLIHPSQKTLESSEDRLLFELRVINNDELFRKIISMTGSIKVIEPLSLQKRVLDELQKALKAYDGK